VFVIHPATGRITSLGRLATPVGDATGVMMGSRLFVFGGSTGSGTSTDLVQVFDPSTRTGAVAGRLPVAASGLGSATVGGTTFLVGGFDGLLTRRAIYATTDGSRFRTAGRLPVGVRHPAVSAVGEALFVAGGESPAGPTSMIYSLDPSSGRVRVAGRLPAAVGRAAAFALRGAVFVVGGVDGSGGAVATVTRFDPTGGAVTPQDPLPGAASAISAAAGVDDAILVGGATGSVPLDQVLVASPA
jgi:N-acetylneuraminic acid mutarotase